MEITIKKVDNNALIRKFIFLPEQIHKHHKNWVHPLYFDDKVFFNPNKNKSFAYSEAIMALAFIGKKAVGRIMGIINHRYNNLHNEMHARFCFLECYEDIEIAKALISYIENWARERGMVKLVGPLGFSDKDPQGIIIEGFEERVVIATNYNFVWMKDFLERLGFSKKVDLVSYKIEVPDKFPDFLNKVYERAMRKSGIKLHAFTTKKQLQPWIVPIFRLLNEAYKNIYGFIPMDEKEMHAFAKRYLPVLDPQYVKAVTNENGTVLAFVIGMPELSEGIRKAKGRIFPFGWYHILKESKKTKMLTLLLGAIEESQRGKGLDALLAFKILESAQQNKMEDMDSHLILETNLPMRAECERFGGKLHKRFRIFTKDIS